jgi:hypothetical protein
MKNLAAKMVAAVHDIDAVTKRGKNEKQGYAYVKAADVAQEVRGVLVKHGIAFDYHVVSAERWEKVTNNGGLMYFCQLEIATTFTDSESGEAKTVNGLGWGMDSGDKAPYKAMTGALKYALRMNFLIPDESDPENDSEDKGKKQVQAIGPNYDSEPEPVFDENGDVVGYSNQAPPKQTPKPNGKVHASGKNDASGKDAITEGKAKRFWAIAISKGKKDAVAEKLEAAGLSDIKFCPWKGDTYNSLIAWAEA